MVNISLNALLHIHVNFRIVDYLWCFFCEFKVEIVWFLIFFTMLINDLSIYFLIEPPLFFMSRQYLQYSLQKMNASGLCLNSTFNRHDKGRLVSVDHKLESCQRRSQAWISKVISLHYHELYMKHGIYEHYIEITFSGRRRGVNWINLLESKIIDLGEKATDEGRTRANAARGPWTYSCYTRGQTELIGVQTGIPQTSATKNNNKNSGYFFSWFALYSINCSSPRAILLSEKKTLLIFYEIIWLLQKIWTSMKYKFSQQLSMLILSIVGLIFYCQRYVTERPLRWGDD